MKFLLVEDDEALASVIEKLLAEHHYVMDLATDGIAGRDMAETFTYDLILMDWMVPKLDGVQLCQHLRNQGNYTPIILMTARDDSTDRVAGLDAGADDYLVKPFEFEELLARIRALLRRAEGIASPVLQWGDLCLDPRNSKVTCRDLPVPVTPKEYALLELFLRNPSRIFSLDNLLDRVWSFEDLPSVGSVRTHIKGLRQKLKKAGLPDIIATVYGLGYRLKSVALPAIADSQKLPEASLDAQAVGSLVGSLNLTSLWQGVSQSYIQRVAELASIIRRLQPGVVEPGDRQQILTEAHALAGSLGSFGFHAVTTHCREIENTLHTNTYLSGDHIQQLETLITTARQTLEQGKSRSLSPAATVAQPPTNLPSALPMPESAGLPPGELFQLLMVQAEGNLLQKTPGDRSQHWLQTLVNTAAQYQIQVSVVDQISQARAVSFPPEGSGQPPPHIVVFDLDGSLERLDDDSAAFKLLADLQSRQPPTPTIVLTAAASFENRIKVARLGIAKLLQVPMPPLELLETAARVLQKGAPPAAKLLIVDDDLAMLTLLQSLLQPWGFQLKLLSDPQQFWQALERFEPDLILLDVKMPQLSGFDLCKVLRNDPQWHDLPVLFMSGHTDAATIQQVFSVGADDYIRKPIVAPELVARVLGWLA
ncbi:MAG: response regulator [Phormidesmis sp.]